MRRGNRVKSYCLVFKDEDTQVCCGNGCKEICQLRWLKQSELPTHMHWVIQLNLGLRQATQARKITLGMEPGQPGEMISEVRGEMSGRITDMVLNKLQQWIKINPKLGIDSDRRAEGNIGLREMMARKLGRQSSRNSGKKRRTDQGICMRLCWINHASFTRLTQVTRQTTRLRSVSG